MLPDLSRPSAAMANVSTVHFWRCGQSRLPMFNTSHYECVICLEGTFLVGSKNRKETANGGIPVL